MEQNENYIIILRNVFTPLVLTFNIYSIKSLIDVSYKDVSNICSNTNIWYYLLTITLLSISGLQKNNNKLESLLAVLQMLVFFIWGSYELFGVNCIDQLKNTNLYIISLTYWILITILLSILVISILYFIFIVEKEFIDGITYDTTSGPRKSNLDVSIHGSLINTPNQIMQSDNDKKDRINRINKLVNNYINKNHEDLDTVLKEVSRIQSNLTQSNLTQSNLTQSNLTQSNLTQSNLTQSNLTQSNLTQSDLA